MIERNEQNTKEIQLSEMNEKSSPSLEKREMQIKAVKYHFKRTYQIEKAENNNSMILRLMRVQALVECQGECKLNGSRRRN